MESSFVRKRKFGVDTADRNVDASESKQNFKSSINAFDGLIHNADGSTTDPTTGSVVDSTSTVQLRSHLKNKNRGFDDSAER